MGEAKRRGAAAGVGLRRLLAPAQPGPLTKFVLPAGPPLSQRELPPDSLALAERVRERMRAALLRGSAERSLDGMAMAIEALGRDCVALFEADVAAAAHGDAARGRELAGVACRRGCAFCCHVAVAVTPLEAIRVWRRARPVTAAPPARRAPCPMLVDGACSVYAERPYACRSVFSSDAARCEAGYASDGVVSVPSLDWPRRLAACYISGELAALADLKLQSLMVELHGALAALQDEGAFQRWLNGAAVFQRRAG